MWLPEGTNINETDRMASSLADYIRGHEETEMVSTYIGRTPPRYYLSNVSFGPQSNYAQILVKCKTSKDSKDLVFRPLLSPNKVIYWKSTGRWLWNTTTT